MKSLVYLFVAFIITSCTSTIKPKEDIASSNTSRVKISTEPKADTKNKLLLIASFTEPFMATQFYTDKAIFTFPEKDSLVWIQAFDSLNFTKDFTISGSIDTKSVSLKIENKPCPHPGSGETWGLKAFIEIDKVKYQGCAKLN